MLSALPVASVLLVLIGLGCLAPSGLDSSYTLHRRTVLTVLIGAVLMTIGHDWWLLVGWAVVVYNALSRPFPAMHLTRLDTIIAFYAVYLVARPFVTPEVIPVVLGGLTVLAPVAYLIGVYWFDDPHCLGQGQQNHADAVSVLSIAAACGLAWSVSAWWLLAMVPSLAVLYWAAQRDGRIGQAVPWLGFVALTGFMLYSPWLGLGLALIGLLYGWREARRLRMTNRGVDGGRVRMWWILLLGGWWQGGRKVRLLGHGWNSWAAWADSFSMLEWKKSGKPLKDYAKDGMFWSHPHSEYVHVLFEHGAVGLGCLLGWMGLLAYSAWQAGPMQQAVLFPAVAMAAIALTHFPWTFPTEKDWGHMGLAVISLVLAILLGGAL